MIFRFMNLYSCHFRQLYKLIFQSFEGISNCVHFCILYVSTKTNIYIIETNITVPSERALVVCVYTQF
jgi:hypothetical protein